MTHETAQHTPPLPPRHPRVMLVLTSPGIGGAGRVVQSLARSLPGEGYSPRSVLPDTDPVAARETLDWFHREGLEAEAHQAVPAWYSRRSPLDILRFAAFIRRRADLVYLHYGNSYISLKDVLAVRLAWRRCYVMVHHAAPLANARLAKMTVLASKLAQRVIVTTPVMHQLLEDAGVNPARIDVIPLAVPPPPELPERAAARHRLGLPSDAFVIVSVARLDPGKNIAMVIEAAAAMREDGPPPYVVVAGQGRELEHLQKLAHERLGDRGRILGFVPDLADTYAAADVFALPSDEEGFGLVYLEAAHHGVPSIGADVGGVRFAIDDGRTGLLIPPRDPDALRDNLERLRSDPSLCATLGRAARARAQKEFSEQLMAARHRATFER